MRIFSGIPTRIRVSLLGLVLLLVTIPLVPQHPQIVVQGVVELGGVAALWWGFWPQREVARFGWGLVFVGISLLAVPDVAAGVGSVLPGAQLSTGTLGLLLAPGYLVTLVGAVRLVLSGSFAAAHRDGWTEVAILGLGVFAPLVGVLVLPGLDDGGGVAAAIPILVYALFATVTMVLVARMLLFDSPVSASLVFFALSAAVTFAAGFWSVGATGDLFSPPSTPVRILWALTFVLVAAGAADRSLPQLTARPGQAVGSAPVVRKVAVLGVGMVLPAVTVLIDVWLRFPFPWVVAGLAVAVSVLAAVRMAGLMQRLSRQSELLADLVNTDELTGLLNRRGLNRAFGPASARTSQAGRPLSVALLDLDRFKAYNDLHGHPAGDAYLRTIASIWTDALTGEEVLARYGGEEFAMLLPGLTADEAAARVDQLRRLVPAPETVSAGVAPHDPGAPPGTTMADADGALYLAKCGGRDRTVVAEYDDGSLPGPLRDLDLVVQPIVGSGDLQPFGFEALSRFPHTTDVEKVFADAHVKGFGDLLEVEVVRRVVAEPRRDPDLCAFVNVSERAMRSVRFWELLPEDLSGIVVELVEHRDGMSDEQLLDLLARFRSRGARIALDDVGSSSTDFARIAALRPDVAKIDRSLVSGCDTSASQAEVLRLIVRLAQSHGATVVIEGVETAGELAVLRETGAEFVQGYLIARPGVVWPLAGTALAQVQRPPATLRVVPAT